MYKRIMVLAVTLLYLCSCTQPGHNNMHETNEFDTDFKVVQSDTSFFGISSEEPLGIEGESYIDLCIDEKYIALFGLRTVEGAMGDGQIATDCITILNRLTLEQKVNIFDFWEDVDPDLSNIAMDFWSNTELLVLCSAQESGIHSYQLMLYDFVENLFEPLAVLNTTSKQEDSAYGIRYLEGNIYISFDSGDILFVNPESWEEIMFSVPLYQPELLSTADGRIIAVGIDGGTVAAVPVSAEENSELRTLIGGTWYQVTDGYGNYDFYITYENQVYGVSLEEQTMTVVFNGYYSGIDLNHVAFFAVGSKMLVCDNVTEDFLVDEYVLYQMDETAQSEESRTVLTLATLRTGSILQEAIVEFNKKNAEYYIELRDYSQYGNREAAMLYADIMAGEIPDILNMEGI